MLNSLPGLSLTKSVVYWLEFLKPLQDNYFTLQISSKTFREILSTLAYFYVKGECHCSPLVLLSFSDNSREFRRSLCGFVFLHNIYPTFIIFCKNIQVHLTKIEYSVYEPSEVRINLTPIKLCFISPLLIKERGEVLMCTSLFVGNAITIPFPLLNYRKIVGWVEERRHEVASVKGNPAYRWVWFRTTSWKQATTQPTL